MRHRIHSSFHTLYVHSTSQLATGSKTTAKALLIDRKMPFVAVLTELFGIPLCRLRPRPDRLKLRFRQVDGLSYCGVEWTSK